MNHLIIWFMLMSRCNLYLRENLDPSLLPPILRQSFGEAMLVEVDDTYRIKILMIRLQLRIWSKFLGGTRISKMRLRYLLTRISKRERNYPIPSILPLSAVSFPKNYERRVRKAVFHAPKGMVYSNMYHYYVEGGTNHRVADLDVVDLQKTHNNGIFEAILVSGDVLMGRKNDPLGLKMCVVKSPFLSLEKVSVFIFHPIQQILIVGREDGTVMFYEFTDNFESITPCFVMNLIASIPFIGKTASIVRRITANPSGTWFYVIEYKYSSSVLVSMDAQNNIVTKPFIPESLFREIGGISAMAFFGVNMAITNHYKKYCVWDLSDLGNLKLLSIINDRNFYSGYVQQIITCGVLSFLFRTSESIFLVRLGDDFTTCSVVVELPVYGRFSTSTRLDYQCDSMALFGNMLVLVVPSECIVKFFLLQNDAIHLLLTKTIETPTCWSYDPRTSVFTYCYESNSYTCQKKFRV